MRHRMRHHLDHSIANITMILYRGWAAHRIKPEVMLEHSTHFRLNPVSSPCSLFPRRKYPKSDTKNPYCNWHWRDCGRLCPIVRRFSKSQDRRRCRLKFYREKEFPVEMCISQQITEILSFFCFHKNFKTNLSFKIAKKPSRVQHFWNYLWIQLTP